MDEKESLFLFTGENVKTEQRCNVLENVLFLYGKKLKLSVSLGLQLF